MPQLFRSIKLMRMLRMTRIFDRFTYSARANPSMVRKGQDIQREKTLRKKDIGGTVASKKAGYEYSNGPRLKGLGLRGSVLPAAMISANSNNEPKTATSSG